MRQRRVPQKERCHISGTQITVSHSSSCASLSSFHSQYPKRSAFRNTPGVWDKLIYVSAWIFRHHSQVKWKELLCILQISRPPLLLHSVTQIDFFCNTFSVLGTLAATYLCAAVIVKYYLKDEHTADLTPEHSEGWDLRVRLNIDVLLYACGSFWCCFVYVSV